MRNSECEKFCERMGLTPITREKRHILPFTAQWIHNRTISGLSLCISLDAQLLEIYSDWDIRIVELTREQLASLLLLDGWY